MSGAVRAYPWQLPSWESLRERADSGRLPHALLFTGPQGVGKHHLARALAQHLLCDQPDIAGACGHCPACIRFAAGTHPDFTVVEPAEEGKAITVQQVRDLAGFQSLTGQYGNRRVVIIDPADRLNVNAANALLKTLEEPTEGTLLILVSSRPATLLPTIRSRCQQLAMAPATHLAAGEWLQARAGEHADTEALLAMSGGAPLAALALADGEALAVREAAFLALHQLANGEAQPVALADNWSGDRLPAQVLRWMFSWLTDMARLKSAPNSARLTNPDLRDRLQALSEPVDLEALLLLLERVQRALVLVQGQVNAQLLVEELLITWARCFTAAAR